MAEGTPDGPPIILHIGPHKTGTTTLQVGLGQNRARLRQQGVIYPGRLLHELNPATAVSTRTVDPGKDLQTATDQWFSMLDEIRSADARLGVLSSEFYSETPVERIGWLMDQLGPQSRVVVTLRPLARIVISQWQQYMQNRVSTSWEDWLRAILADPRPGKVTPSFWIRHRHDLLVRRWLDVIGPDRLTVVAVDDHDPEFVLRSFEQLLHVEQGSLTPNELRANRSLTLEEVELVRRFNQLYTASGFKMVDYTPLIRYGAVRFMQTRSVPPEEHRILMPEWARERVMELAGMMIDDIVDSGVTIVGPIRNLADPDLAPKAGVNPEVTTARPELAAELAAGVVDAMGRYRPARDPDPIAAPVLTAVLRTNRSAAVRPTTATLDKLRRRIDEAEEQAAEQLLITDADRGDAFRELARRVRRRLRGLLPRR